MALPRTPAKSKLLRPVVGGSKQISFVVQCPVFIDDSLVFGLFFSTKAIEHYPVTLVPRTGDWQGTGHEV